MRGSRARSAAGTSPGAGRGLLARVRAAPRPDTFRLVKAGSVKAGSVKAGPIKAGPIKAGPIKAGPIKAGSVAARLARSCEGATAVEFGLLALPFLMLVTGIMDCSRIVWTHLALQVAVEQAARCAAVDTTTCGTAAQVQAYAASVMLAPGVGAADFSYAATACGSQVSASTNFAVLVPGYLPATVTLTAQFCDPA